MRGPMTAIANPPLIAPLRERVVLVTGATGGVGAPLARACAAQGATVVLHARVVRKLEALYDEIVDAGHPEPVILPLDLAKATADDFGNVAARSPHRLGRLDALVHTAALLGYARSDRASVVRQLALAPARERGRAHGAHARRDAASRARRPMRASCSRSTTAASSHAPTGAATPSPRPASPRWRASSRTNGRTGRNLRINAVVPGPIRSPLRGQTHPGEDRASLPPPDALVPLYLHLIAGQSKADSGSSSTLRTGSTGAPCSKPLARIAQHDAQPPEVVRRQHVRARRARARDHRAPSARHTMLVSAADT